MPMEGTVGTVDWVVGGGPRKRRRIGCDWRGDFNLASIRRLTLALGQHEQGGEHELLLLLYLPGRYYISPSGSLRPICSLRIIHRPKMDRAAGGFADGQSDRWTRVEGYCGSRGRTEKRLPDNIQ
jgi:hypothetical protein